MYIKYQLYELTEMRKPVIYKEICGKHTVSREGISTLIGLRSTQQSPQLSTLDFIWSDLSKANKKP